MKTISKKQAIANNHTRYFTGIPCSRGHVDERRVSNGSCVSCENERKKNKWKTDTQYRTEQLLYLSNYSKTHREQLSQKEKDRYSTNKHHREMRKASNSQSRNRHIERRRKQENEYRKTHREQVATYRDCNKDRLNQLAARYRNKNRNLIASKARDRYASSSVVKANMLALNARRRAKKLNATPNWLTSDDLQQIEQIYQQALTLTEQTGIKHVVDHYYPLQGKTVSGLHCIENLRIIPEHENAAKKNKHPEEFYKD